MEQIARKFSMSRKNAAVVLSRWTNYKNRQRHIIQHFLVHKKTAGVRGGWYEIGPDWWGERYFDTAKIPYETYTDEMGTEEVNTTVGRRLHGKSV